MGAGVVVINRVLRRQLDSWTRRGKVVRSKRERVFGLIFEVLKLKATEGVTDVVRVKQDNVMNAEGGGWGARRVCAVRTMVGYAPHDWP